MKLLAPLLTLAIIIIVHGCSTYTSPSGAKRRTLGKNTDLEIIKHGDDDFYLAVGQDEAQSFRAAATAVTTAVGVWGLTDIVNTIAGAKVARDAVAGEVLQSRQKAQLAEKAIEAKTAEKLLKFKLLKK